MRDGGCSLYCLLEDFEIAKESFCASTVLHGVGHYLLCVCVGQKCACVYVLCIGMPYGTTSSAPCPSHLEVSQ